MKLSRAGLVLILVAAMPLAASAAEPSRAYRAAAPLTVRDFAVMLAASTESGRGLEADKAVDALVKSGVPLGDPGLPLSERKLAEILRFYGVQARTSSPDQLVSRAKARTALLAAGNSAASGGVGAAAKTGVLPADALDECLLEVNHGQCVGCCKDLGGTATNCAKFCHQINQSASEPQP